jgi:hypothetical protein
MKACGDHDQHLACYLRAAHGRPTDQHRCRIRLRSGAVNAVVTAVGYDDHYIIDTQPSAKLHEV